MDYSRIDEYASPFQPPHQPLTEYERLLGVFSNEAVAAADVRAALAFRTQRSGRAGEGALPRPLEQAAAAAAPALAAGRAPHDGAGLAALRSALLTALGPHRVLDAAWLCHLRSPRLVWPIDEAAARSMRFSKLDRTVAQLDIDSEVDLVAALPQSWRDVDDYQRWAEQEQAPRNWFPRLKLFAYWSAFGRKLRTDLKVKLGWESNLKLNRGLLHSFELRMKGSSLAQRELALPSGEAFELSGDPGIGYVVGHGEHKRYIGPLDLEDIFLHHGGTTIAISKLDTEVVHRSREAPLSRELAAALVTDGYARAEGDSSIFIL